MRALILCSVVYADGSRLDVLTRTGSDGFLVDSIKSGIKPSSFVRHTTAAGSGGPSLRHTGLSGLDRRTWDRAVRTEYATIASFGF